MLAFPWFSHRTLALRFIILLTVSLAFLQASPATAQPLCLGGTIWDADEEMCVPMEPSPTPTEEQAEPSPTEAVTIDEDEGDDEDGEEDAPDSDEPVDATGDEVEPTPTSDSQERADGGSAILVIYVYACPSYADPLNLYDQALYSACHGIVRDVTLELGAGGTSLGTRTVTSGQGGGEWTDIPSGFVEVTITPPGGYNNPLVATCDRSAYNMPPAQSRRFADTTGTNSGITGFDMQVKGNELWHCYVYFQEEPTGTIRLEVWHCPDGLNIYGSGPDTLQASCTASMSGMEFILVHNPDGVFNTIATGTVGAVFYPLGEGTGNVRMVPPAGIGLPNIYCGTTGPQGQTLSTYDWVYVSIDASFDVSIPHDAYVSCNVYVVNGGIPVEQPARDPAIVEGMPPATPTSDAVKPGSS